MSVVTRVLVPGLQGPRGHDLLTGVGAPDDAVGRDGDHYVDRQAALLYGPRAGGAWPAEGTPLVGEALDVVLAAAQAASTDAASAAASAGAAAASHGAADTAAAGAVGSASSAAASADAAGTAAGNAAAVVDEMATLYWIG